MYGNRCKVKNNGRTISSLTYINFYRIENRHTLHGACVIESLQVIDQAWDAVFHHQVRQREESWKYDAQRSIFDEFRGVWSGDETLCRMLDITSQTKWF